MRTLLRNTRTRRRTAAIGLGLVVVSVVAATLYFGRSRFSVATYDRLWLGMTLAEAEAALGATSGRLESAGGLYLIQKQEGVTNLHMEEFVWRQTGPGTTDAVSQATGEVIAEGRRWTDGDCTIVVILQDGRLAWKCHQRAMPPYEVWVRQQLARLGF